jgi:phosphohistidine phosphatase SixA
MLNLRAFVPIGLGVLLLAAAGVQAAPDHRADLLKNAGRVLMIRHARAPGTGDPPQFEIGDCTTQRNLDAQGRAQARDIGAWLRARGIDKARVFSSQWCRCLETAALIDLGPVTPLTALNSFFERPQEREARLAALRDFMAQLPPEGGLVVMVTHFVTIAGISGEGVSSGEGVVLALTAGGAPRVIGRLDFSPAPTP